MKTTRRIITIALALAIIFAFAAPAFAQISGNLPTDGGDSNYVQTNLSDYYVNGQITVHLHVTTYLDENNNYIDEIYDVTVGTANATNQLITVKDVLEEADDDNTDIAFTIEEQYVTLTNTWEYYLTEVHDTTVTPSRNYYDAVRYKGGNAYGCGYMFRINGMIPYFTHTVNGNSKTEGCLIGDAYVTANDTIDLYYATAQDHTWGTRVEYIRQVSNKTFQLLDTQCYKTNNLQGWELLDWEPRYWDEVVYIYIDDELTAVYVDDDGMFTRSGLSAGTHSFRPKTYCTPFTNYSGNTEYGMPYEVGMYTEYVVS